jgi:ElaB/YqjD/DUF883 family membrane-anchored ribosome-binding protein
MVENTSATRDKLLEDFNKVVTDTEELLRSMATVGGEKASSWRASVEENLRDAKQRLATLQDSALETTREAATAADEYVRANPWQAIGVAAGVGFLVGLLMSRR